MKRKYNAGFAGLPLVTALALILTLSLAMLFKSTVMNRDQASHAQLSGDYHQREEALMRAMVAIFPKRAIASMKGGYASSSSYSWSKIFADSIALSSVSQRLSPEVIADLALESMRSGDVGDRDAAQVQSWITSLTGTAGQVTPGTTAYSNVFSQAQFAGKVPPLLDVSQALQTADADRPVVSTLKRYTTQDAGLFASVASYPLYNLIPYPNIRFGYAAPGQPFVAKRNWWAFTVTYGNSAKTVAKNYVLSLYEVPSQMSIEASAFAAIGRHKDGTAWNSDVVNIDGSVYADRLAMDGAFGASRLAGRESIDMVSPLTLNGVEVSNDFDAMGVRERLQAQSVTDVLPVALSANSGRLAFLPLVMGSQFLLRAAPGATLTDWQNYTAGAQKCRITVEAIAMVSYADQTPTAIRIRFQTAAGSTTQVTFQRGVNWPTALQTGGATLPFQTELTNNGRSCVTFFPTLLNAWLQSSGGASVATNNSIFFGVDPTADITVRPLTEPPEAEQMCVIIRKGKDLTDYTTGLALVAPLRVYVGDDFNDVPAAAAPVGSGLPAGTEFYPPMCIFSAELRIGTTAVTRLIAHHGQLGTLTTGTVNSWAPLEMKAGSDDAVHTDSITADLAPLRSPADLPPIYQMNWLVVIEEIPQD
jgi:hypothetical protein